MKKHAPAINAVRAQAMRAAPTIAEARLWWLLRERLPGAKLRRQVPIASHIADFVCHAGRLIVELDGEQHGLDAARRRDAARTRTLEGEGYRVVRFWNFQVLREAETVVETIVGTLVAQGCAAPEVGAAAGRGHRRRALLHPSPLALSRESPSPSRGGKG